MTDELGSLPTLSPADLQNIERTSPKQQVNTMVNPSLQRYYFMQLKTPKMTYQHDLQSLKTEQRKGKLFPPETNASPKDEASSIQASAAKANLQLQESLLQMSQTSTTGFKQKSKSVHQQHQEVLDRIGFRTQTKFCE